MRKLRRIQAKAPELKDAPEKKKLKKVPKVVEWYMKGTNAIANKIIEKLPEQKRSVTDSSRRRIRPKKKV